jgi:hypothetical protein
MAELDFRQMPKWMPEALEIQALIDTWARSYEVPREAIIRQIGLAYAWAQSNKKRAPKKQVTRFLNNWMRLAQKHGNLVKEHKNYEEKVVQEDMTFEEMQEIRRKNLGNRRSSAESVHSLRLHSIDAEKE